MYRIFKLLFLISIIQNTIASPIGMIPSNSFSSIFEKSNGLFDDQRGIHPDFIQISIKKLRNDISSNEKKNTSQERQIPVISDIERIKKVIEIIEFVGDKVGDLIDKIQVPPKDSNETIYDDRSLENSTLQV